MVFLNLGQLLKKLSSFRMGKVAVCSILKCTPWNTPLSTSSLRWYLIFNVVKSPLDVFFSIFELYDMKKLILKFERILLKNN